jgi:hypothetical protein
MGKSTARRFAIGWACLVACLLLAGCTQSHMLVQAPQDVVLSRSELGVVIVWRQDPSKGSPTTSLPDDRQDSAYAKAVQQEH